MSVRSRTSGGGVEGWSTGAERTVDGEVVRVWVRDDPEPAAPRRPVVVMAHGLEAAWTSWLPMIGRLPRHFQVCLLDLPWRSRGSYRWLHHGAGHWLAAVTAMLPEPPDAFVGHSFGANAVVEHLITAPSGPGAVVLAAPFHQTSRWIGAATDYEEFQRTFRHVLADGLQLSLGQRGRDLRPADFDALLDRVSARIEGPGLRAVVDHIATSVSVDLTGLTQPVLVVSGSLDPTSTPEMGAAMAADLPNGHRELLVDCGHFVHVERAGRVADLVDGFLRTHLGTGRVAQPIR